MMFEEGLWMVFCSRNPEMICKRKRRCFVEVHGQTYVCPEILRGGEFDGEEFR